MFKPEATTAQYFDWTWDREHGRIVERNFPVKLREGMRVEFRAEASIYSAIRNWERRR